MKPRLIQQVKALFVLNLDHPKIGIKAALFGDRGVNFGLIPLNQDYPFAITGHQIKTALIAAGLPIQCVQFDQHSPCCCISTLDDKCRYFDQPQPCQIGRNPDVRRQLQALPSLKSRPISEYRSDSSSQLGRTLTFTNRCTRRPRNSSSSSREA